MIQKWRKEESFLLHFCQVSWPGLQFLQPPFSPGDLPNPQQLNPSLLHCRQILCHLSHQGSQTHFPSSKSYHSSPSVPIPIDLQITLKPLHILWAKWSSTRWFPFHFLWLCHLMTWKTSGWCDQGLIPLNGLCFSQIFPLVFFTVINYVNVYSLNRTPPSKKKERKISKMIIVDAGAIYKSGPASNPNVVGNCSSLSIHHFVQKSLTNWFII